MTRGPVLGRRQFLISAAALAAAAAGGTAALAELSPAPAAAARRFVVTSVVSIGDEGSGVRWVLQEFLPVLYGTPAIVEFEEPIALIEAPGRLKREFDRVAEQALARHYPPRLELAFTMKRGPLTELVQRGDMVLIEGLR